MLHQPQDKAKVAYPVIEIAKYIRRGILQPKTHYLATNFHLQELLVNTMKIM